ncbi:ankyrin repeat domain-containing protein 6 [Patella vulgata]|uniref:ankyrin repeat domain-containing protein 6 n=1 Tax=Patella vulgata TaxID=6465 RepID=UPI0024A7C68D|nr:ankyrin repeat domain-containing protein 6 [Patella vulgata]XP_050410886.2 ankyrin repeat domain-containing protein 6 [Patella vulgata]XP_050410946.2 ankyrin repeat domain-containing protein 6 [Patella vulgata]XP_050411040.2 ankyrin repeat domain-containing protein 6 [Patella vulgata]
MGQAASRQEAFWEACGFGHVRRVERYIEEGIDVNWVSYTHDCCPIHVASQGKPEIVRLLLEQNCDVNVTDIRGNTPLHHAAMKGHSDIMQTLISAGCKIDTEDKNGWTALHNAAYWCHLKAVKVLLKNKCDITITHKDSRTAVHEVARSKEKEEITLGEIARLLLQAGSDKDARGSDLGEADFTGLMFASYHGHSEVATAFIEAGCDINCTGSSNNWSALHWAADRGQDELVYLLLEAGVDPTIRAYRGETAADRAKSPEIKETILNAINMFEELRGLDSKSSKTKPGSNMTRNAILTSPAKNKLTNRMVDDIFNKMPPMKVPKASTTKSEQVSDKSSSMDATNKNKQSSDQIQAAKKLSKNETENATDESNVNSKMLHKIPDSTEVKPSNSRTDSSLSQITDKVEDKLASSQVNELPNQITDNCSKVEGLSNQICTKIENSEVSQITNDISDNIVSVESSKNDNLTNEIVDTTEHLSIDDVKVNTIV